MPSASGDNSRWRQSEASKLGTSDGCSKTTIGSFAWCNGLAPCRRKPTRSSKKSCDRRDDCRLEPSVQRFGTSDRDPPRPFSSAHLGGSCYSTSWDLATYCGL